jgi:Antitoxin VbhA
MTSRRRAAAIALGSVRAEGLEPSLAVVELLERWGCGEVTDAELEAAEKTLAEHGTLTSTAPGIAS